MIHLQFLLQKRTDDAGSAPSKSTTTKRRRSSGQSKAVEGPLIISPGSDLTLLTKPPKEGGIVYVLQPLFVPEIIARCGMRWWNAHCNADITNVLREIVVRHNLGQFGPLYDKLREAKPASELAVLRVLRTSHQHTAKDHFWRTAAIVEKLFRQTNTPAINYVKSKVFGIENGAPILDDDHPLIQELKDAAASGAHVMFWAIFFKSDLLCFLQMARLWLFSRTTKTRKVSQPWGSVLSLVRRRSPSS